MGNFILFSFFSLTLIREVENAYTQKEKHVDCNTCRPVILQCGNRWPTSTPEDRFHREVKSKRRAIKRTFRWNCGKTKKRDHRASSNTNQRGKKRNLPKTQRGLGCHTRFLALLQRRW